MNEPARVGRCQHCGQIRPLFLHEGELQFWGYDPSEAAWLCARDWSAREVAIDNNDPFLVNRSILPFGGEAIVAAAEQITQAAADQAVIDGIAAATAEAEGGTP